MRTFLALDLEESVVDEACRLSQSLGPHLLGAKWTRRALMHVTVRFLGDTDAALVPQLAEGTVAIGARHPEVLVTASSLAAFPDPHRARVLVLSLTDGEELAAIAREAEALAVSLGFPPETRAFHPHLTLARFKVPADVRGIVRDVRPSASGAVTALTLYESELGKGEAGTPLYTPLASSAASTPSSASVSKP